MYNVKCALPWEIVPWGLEPQTEEVYITYCAAGSVVIWLLHQRMPAASPARL